MSFKEAPNPKTPATKAEQKAAKANKGKKNFGKQTIDSIKSMIKEHNDKSKYKITLAQAKEIVQRGKGAFSSTHSPQVSSPTEWGMRRLSTFLSALRSGSFKNKKFDGDIYDKIRSKV